MFSLIVHCVGDLTLIKGINMKSLVRLFRRCVCCAVTAAFIASNAYTYKVSHDWTLEDVCSDISYYHNEDRELVRVKSCEGK